MERDGKRGSLLIHVNLADDFHLLYKQHPDETGRSMRVSFLPPLHMTFEMPVGYPTEKPPIYSLRCVWITKSQMEAVKEKLHSLWLEGSGSVVLFTWFNFLANELTGYLQLHDSLNVNDLAADKTTMQDGPSTNSHEADHALGDLLSFLFEFNESHQERLFESAAFECSICFASKAGVECTQLRPCLHVFCKECSRTYFEVQITDGKVTSLTCPQKGCESTATPLQVEKLVSKELFTRYETLLLRRCFDSMADVVCCPRASCQAPAVLDSNGNVAVCSVCRYAFCVKCKRLYHGVELCLLDEEERAKVTFEYLDGNDATRKALKATYGRQPFFAQLERAESYKMTKANLEYMDAHVKNCPNCRARIEKDGGCNRVYCVMCCHYMCWACGEALKTDEGYNHFHVSSGCALWKN